MKEINILTSASLSELVAAAASIQGTTSLRYLYSDASSLNRYNARSISLSRTYKVPLIQIPYYHLYCTQISPILTLDRLSIAPSYYDLLKSLYEKNECNMAALVRIIPYNTLGHVTSMLKDPEKPARFNERYFRTNEVLKCLFRTSNNVDT